MVFTVQFDERHRLAHCSQRLCHIFTLCDWHNLVCAAMDKKNWRRSLAGVA